MSEATIGTMSRNGLYQIIDTSWDRNGTLTVTVREMMVGERLRDDVYGRRVIRAMRDTARRAIAHPEKTRSARLVRTFYAGGQTHATFAVSRLER